MRRLPFAIRLLVTGIIVTAWPTQSSAATTRLALVVGNNIGNDGEFPLRYAHSDADAVASLLNELGGFDSNRVRLLIAHQATDLQRELDQFRGAN